MIKARLEGAKGAWLEELPGVLWAYRTTAMTLTGGTPFRLAFGIEAVIPIVVWMSSLRWVYYDDPNNDVELKLALEFLDEVRDDLAQRMALYQQRMSEYHNQRVKLKRFNSRDMVLQKDSQATKDPTRGKLGPNQEGPYKVVCYSRQGSYCLEDLDWNPLPSPWNAKHLKKYYQ